MTQVNESTHTMGILDNLLGNSGAIGGIAALAMKNPKLLGAAVSLLSAKDSSVGGSGGLGAMVQAFQGKGLGDVMSSWISTGENKSISADQVSNVLGKDTLSQFATKAGIKEGEAGSVLAGLLPNLVDHLTPSGKMPEGSALESVLGGLMSGLKR